MSTQAPIELDRLAEGYDVIGELAGGSGDDARSLIGTRRSDGKPVLITVVNKPKDDEGNALSHLAADTNLLATLSHRALLPVIEGEWIGTDAFAVVSQRPSAPSLTTLIARERLSYARCAAILREVNAVIEWAREQGIVHRGVSAATVFVEPQSDRTTVTFGATALPAHGTPGPASDAATVARLAREMLQGREDIPERLVAETESLLGGAADRVATPDVHTFVALVAMADAVKRGEEHAAETAMSLEKQRQECRTQIDSERAEHERVMAAQREDTQHRRQEMEQALAKQKAELEAQHATRMRELEERQEQRFREIERQWNEQDKAVAARMKELEREREQQEKAFSARMRELEKQFQEKDRMLSRERKLFERDMVRQREQLRRESERQREQLRRDSGAASSASSSLPPAAPSTVFGQALEGEDELVASESDLDGLDEYVPLAPVPTPDTGHTAAPPVRARFDREVERAVPLTNEPAASTAAREDSRARLRALMSEPAANPRPAASHAAAPVPPRRLLPVWASAAGGASSRRPLLNRAWVVPTLVILFAFVVAATAVAIGKHRHVRAPQTASGAAATIDSVGGNVSIAPPLDSTLAADTTGIVPEPGRYFGSPEPASDDAASREFQPEPMTDTAQPIPAAVLDSAAIPAIDAAPLLPDTTRVLEPVPLPLPARRDSVLAPRPAVPLPQFIVPRIDSTARPDSTAQGTAR